ncbi:hypothetical protein AOC36_05610 [Erysipelothrix larvae]|uniref:DUF554 domain-containing protein n=1 Tax=Erysipelothrix larvae TaxID=1514105 RepID=A0A0X8GZV2_9FIRM|nr:DUF554 domain-containing protein [Erysipelothrix larvae]AMC93473.1 hypothetical protein AOC36_05610 [Erysipelothrix larvae]
MGIIVNSLSVLIGGLCGARFKDGISRKLKDSLPVVFGLCSIVMGVTKVILMDNLTVVVLSIITGYIIGEMLRLGALINALCSKLAKRFNLKSKVGMELLTVGFVTFCFSGTGFLGAFLEGLTGDSTILLSKSILDFFTAIIFASIAGYAIGFISVFQIIILTLIKVLSLTIEPALQGVVMSNFVAVGGVFTIAIGFKMMKLIDLDIANFLPAMLLVIIISNVLLII